MNNIFDEFNKYVDEFDHNIDGVLMKHQHTFRVVGVAKKIAISLNLNDDDTDLAIKCALLHDIARFKQITEYGTFIDHKSFDHGDIGEVILKENNYISKYEDDKYKQSIILASVRNHNKKQIEDNLDEKTILFCKIVRDADKIDILRTQGIFDLSDNVEISKNVYESLKNGHMVTNTDVKSKADSALRQLGFIYDLYFKESYKIIKEEKIVDNIINNLKKYSDSNLIDEVYKLICNYLDERINE